MSSKFVQSHVANSWCEYFRPASSGHAVDVVDVLGCSSCHSMPDSGHGCTKMLVDVIDVPGCSSCHFIPDNRLGCT